MLKIGEQGEFSIMGDKYIYRFGIQHDKSWAWHIGVFFCVEPKHEDGKRDMYLFFCIGKHDFSIGFMHLDFEN